MKEIEPLTNKYYRSFTFSEKNCIKERISFLIDIFRYFDYKTETTLIRRKRSARRVYKKY